MSTPRPIPVVIVSAALSAIPQVGGPLQTVYDAIDERRRYRIESTAREIADLAGHDRLVERVLEDSRVEALLGEALEAAARTGFEAKRRLLGRAVADALLSEDEAAVDYAALIVTALTQLEPLHVRALIRLERHTDLKYEQAAEWDQLAVHRTLAEPVAAALIYTGVATPGMAAGPPMYVREITEFGRALLGQLRGVADEEMERLAD
ncbi:hypothetical protein WU83_06355 [Mycobacterium nebraskense]|nr:hypothetical protein WU83_06355 [Mycobacterium nebraskense]